MWTANPAIYALASESFRLIAVIDERLGREQELCCCNSKPPSTGIFGL